MVSRDIIKKIQQIELRGSPEGCQKVAGGRSASGDLRYANEPDATLKGSQNAGALRSLTLAPLQGAKQFSMPTGVSPSCCVRRLNPRLSSGTPSARTVAGHFTVRARHLTPGT